MSLKFKHTLKLIIFHSSLKLIWCTLPGKTPGVKTPGDVYYFSDFCKNLRLKAVTRPLTYEDNDELKFAPLSSSLSRNLLSKAKKRPPAWGAEHLNRYDIAEIENAVSFYSSKRNYCPFFTKNCIIPNVLYTRRIPKTGGIAHINFTSAQWNTLLNIPKNSWGNCALIGLADTLLKSERGSEIDSHDTIIRLGELPLHGYEKYVGTRTDVTWVRRSGKMSPKGSIKSDRESVRLYIGHNNGIVNMPTLNIFNYVREQEGISHYYAGIAAFIYKLFEVKNWNKNSRGKKKPRGPSSGFSVALNLIFSGLCNRTDLYGFSFNCGGAYHNKKHLMQISHNCELESWFFHYLMKEHPELGACVYL